MEQGACFSSLKDCWEPSTQTLALAKFPSLDLASYGSSSQRFPPAPALGEGVHPADEFIRTNIFLFWEENLGQHSLYYSLFILYLLYIYFITTGKNWNASNIIDLSCYTNSDTKFIPLNLLRTKLDVFAYQVGSKNQVWTPLLVAR